MKRAMKTFLAVSVAAALFIGMTPVNTMNSAAAASRSEAIGISGQHVVSLSETYKYKGFKYYLKKESGKYVLYKKDLESKQQSKILNLGIVTGQDINYGVFLACGNYAYVCDDTFDGGYMYIVNMKTKKITKSPRESLLVGNKLYGNFYAITYYSGDYGLYGAYVLNAKKGKIITLAKKGSRPQAAGAMAYYVKAGKNGSYSVMSYDIKNDKKKTVKTFKNDIFNNPGEPAISDVEKDSCIVYNGNWGPTSDVTYKLTFSTGEMEKITD